ncbi:MAG: phosphodiesterase [Amylibacter sp.]
MTKLIWLSDSHFTANGLALGHDPRIRLQAAIVFINSHHNAADCCIISGDLVNRGSDKDYAALAKTVKSLTVPLLPMGGNHDDRAKLRSHFRLPQTAMPDFVQYSVTTPNAQILCLDTQKTGSDAGEFCPDRSNWLEIHLTQNPETPTYLFMHHPPRPLGLPMQDADCMENGKAFHDLLARHRLIKHLFVGHVHRPVTGTMNTIPFATMRSVLYQAPPPIPDWNWDTFAPAAEAPQLGVLTMDGLDCHLHYTQFCDFQTGT